MLNIKEFSVSFILLFSVLPTLLIGIIGFEPNVAKADIFCGDGWTRWIPEIHQDIEYRDIPSRYKHMVSKPELDAKYCETSNPDNRIDGKGLYNSCGEPAIYNNIVLTPPRCCRKEEEKKSYLPPLPTPTQPTCFADTWTCGAWNSCPPSGIQSRSCTKTSDCPSVETAPPVTNQYCEPPNRPTQQVPPSGTDELLNQDLIMKATVKLLCPVDTQRASQGSGTIVDPSGTILTNKHVIAGTSGCLVGFINDFNDEPYFGKRHIADIFKVSSSEDIAILKIRNPQNNILPSIDIMKVSSDLRLGVKITTYGYPAKFGTKITYTSGEFSGTDGNYLKTTAILEYGNSGGGAYFKDGTFIGIPSAVVKGELNALGYILSINIINSWLGNSSITLSDISNNKYSRVSILEDIDLNKLDSLKLFIPDTDDKGDLSEPAVKQEPQSAEEPQQSQVQEESIVIESDVIESDNSNQEISPAQNSESLEKEQKPKQKKLVKTVLVNIFTAIKNFFIKLFGGNK